jgi:hypothetical protein
MAVCLPMFLRISAITRSALLASLLSSTSFLWNRLTGWQATSGAYGHTRIKRIILV